jgi:hypothetical protein
MLDIVTNILEKFELGKLRQHANLQIYPLFFSGNHSPEYLTLKEALEKNLLIISELTKEGSVPELMVENRSDSMVLLLDGEELMGAKQNRVLNTTILLKKKSRTTIPVSCTEQGRWSYVSPVFLDSDVVASSRVRASKVSSVSDSLRAGRRFSADQSEVWEQVRFMSLDAGVSSPTSAMKDIYRKREKDLNDYPDKFPVSEGQKGLLVLIDGKVTGLDYISYEPAFRLLHPKLIKSYAMDALLSKQKKETDSSGKKAKDFLAGAKECEEKNYESVGHGRDHRYDGKGIVGSALVYENKVIHLAFFSAGENEKTGRMSSSSQRKGYRIL